MAATGKADRQTEVDDVRAERELLDRWVEPDPYRPAEVRLAHYGVAVWALVGHARGLDGDAEEQAHEVARAYGLPVDAVRAALAYYRRHPLQIDARLEANEAAHAG